MNGIAESLHILPNIVTPGTAALATVQIDAKGRVTAFSAAPTTGSGSVVLATNPVIVTPTIADQTNMQHAHTSAASGGSLDAAAIGSGTLLNGRVNWASPSDIGSITPAAGTFTAWRVLQNSAANTIGAASSGRPYLYFDFPQQTSRWSAGFTADSPFSNNFVIASSGDGGATYTQRMTVSNLGAVAMAVIAPLADSTTALKVTKADGSTAVVTVDTTNSRVGIGVAPSFAFHIVDSTFNMKASLATGLQVKTGGVSGWTNLGAPSGSVILALYNGSDVLVGKFTEAGVLTVTSIDTVTASVADVAILDHSTSGTPTTAYGTGLRFRGQSSTTASQEMGRVRTAWTDATHLSRASKMVLSTYNVASEVDVLTLTSLGAVTTNATTSSSQTIFDVQANSASKFKVRDDGIAIVSDSLWLTNSNAFISSGRLFLNSNVGTGSDFILLKHSDTTTAFQIKSNSDIIMQPSGTGKVGISTSAPNHPLQVGAGSGAVGSGARAGFYNTGNAYMIFRDTSNSVELSAGVGLFNTTRYAYIGSNTNHGFAINVNNGNPAFIVDTSSRVGIGTEAPGAFLHVIATDAATAAVTDVAILDHSTSGTPAASYGTGLRFRGQDSTTASQEMGRVRTVWTDVTHLSRTSKMVLSAYNAGTEVDVLTLVPKDTSGGASAGAVLGSNALPTQIFSNVYATDMAFLEINRGISTGLDQKFAALSLVTNQSGVANAVGAVYFSNSNLATAEKRIAYYSVITDGATNSGAIVLGTANAGTLAERLKLDKTGLLKVETSGVQIGGDPGSGAASTTTLTNATGTPVNAVTPAGYVKVYIGTVASYVPYYQ